MAFSYRAVPEAKKEIEEALRYYFENGGIDIVDRFTITLDTVAEMLEAYPESGSAFEAVDGVRSSKIPKFPYRLYYRIGEDELEVVGLSVYHSKRDLDKLVLELKKRIGEE